MPKPTPEELAAFVKHVAAFIPTTPDELLQLIDSQETAIVFLGKPSCSYCRRFVAKLLTVSLNKQLTIHFTDSSNKIALKTFREQHGHQNCSRITQHLTRQNKICLQFQIIRRRNRSFFERLDCANFLLITFPADISVKIRPKNFRRP